MGNVDNHCQVWVAHKYYFTGRWKSVQAHKYAKGPGDFLAGVGGRSWESPTSSLWD